MGRFKEHHRSQRKGQVSIEYIAGFILFIFVVSFIAASVIQNTPRAYQDRAQNNLNSEAWIFSELLFNSTARGGAESSVFDAQRISALSVCTPYNPRDPRSIGAYENIRGNFSIAASREFHAVLSQWPVVFTKLQITGASGINYTGSATIEGVSASFEVGNLSVPTTYNSVRVNNGPLLREGNVTAIGGKVYVVRKIATDGRFVILSRAIIDCGRTVPLGTSVVNVRRFGNFDNKITTLDIEYW